MASDRIDIEIGKRLRQGREAAGLSQSQLADQLGISVQRLGEYEEGLSRIGSGKLYKTAHVLGVKVTYFFVDVDYLLDSETLPGGTSEVEEVGGTSQALDDLSEEDLKNELSRLIAVLRKKMTS